MADTVGTTLQTISQVDGKTKVPTTRIASALDAQELVKRLQRNDQKRSQKRAAVRGLVDGNPPYRQTSLTNAGRAEACNVNWGTARTYLEAAVGSFYDLTSEAPGIIAIRTSFGDEEHREEYCRIMSSEADALFRRPELDWDFEMQQSQNEMVLHGRGPFLFENEDKPFPRSVHDGDLKVPERTPATVSRWEMGTVDVDYYPPQLYKFIQDPEAAKARGWDVEYTQKVIANAMGIQQPTSRAWDWEFYQDQLKQNSATFMDDSKICPLSHVLWQEFEAEGNVGGISHAIVQRDGMANTEPQYLFFKHERYENFQRCVHPMYFDRGNGGFHYSVTGLGVKMYGAMVYENRLLCNLMDKAFAPKIFFKFGSSTSEQKFQLTTFGDWGRVPAGTEVIQNPIQGLLQDGLGMYRTASELQRSNLSSYRQQVAPETPGNPPTAFQKRLEASQQSALSKTSLNRYYTQLDLLYAEIARRLCNIATTDALAQEFQKSCMDKGVPKECFGRVTSVAAVRVVGEGNSFLRKGALSELTPIAAGLPEDGQTRWKNDLIAATAGQSAVERYNPAPKEKETASSQDFYALEALSMAKQGIPPLVVPNQNPVTFAGTFLHAATESLGSLKQGADPATVLQFLHVAGPVILAHLKRFAQDPMRAQVFKQMFAQWQKVGQMTDQLQAQAEKTAQAKQQQQAAAGAAMSDGAIKAATAKGKLDMAKEKQDATLKMRQEAHEQSLAEKRQTLAIADAQAASEIHRKNQMAVAEDRRKQQAHATEQAQEKETP